MRKTEDILEDIRTVDERLGDGIQVSGALQLLSDSYGRLATAGTPPGVDEADYQSRLTTLQSFAQQAADIYDANPSDGEAKYEVVRSETKPILTAVNKATGKRFALPPR